eukprot:6196418-Pleurochrysis_carterae.AAC.5
MHARLIARATAQTGFAFNRCRADPTPMQIKDRRVRCRRCDASYPLHASHRTTPATWQISKPKLVQGC